MTDSERGAVQHHSTSRAAILQVIRHHRPVVLVFLPNMKQFERFVLTGAFDHLGETYELRFVVSPHDAKAMCAAAPTILRDDNTYHLEILAKRSRIWTEVFEDARHVYAKRPKLLAPGTAKRPKSKQQDVEFRLLANAWRAARALKPILRHVPIIQRDNGKLKLKPRRFLKEGTDYINSFVTMGHEHPAFDDTNRIAKCQSLLHRLTNLRTDDGMADLLDRVDPLFCVLPTSWLDSYCNDLLMASVKLNHTVIALQSDWDDLLRLGFLPHNPNYIGVWGSRSNDYAQRIPDVSECVTLGAPHYEVMKPATEDERQSFRTRLGIKPDDRLILFGGSPHFGESALLHRLEKEIEEEFYGPGTIKVLYRPHPLRVDRRNEEGFFSHVWRHIILDPDMEHRFHHPEQKPVAPGFQAHEIKNLSLALSAADFVISRMSKLLLEALIIDKPTLALAFGNDEHPDVLDAETEFNYLRKLGIVDWCADVTRFTKSLRRLLSRSEPNNDPVLRGQALDQFVLARPDESYSQRLDAFARSTIEPVAKGRRMNRVSRKRVSISHIYDAHLIARDYCKLEEVHSIPGRWMHGWIPSYHNVHPLIVAWHEKAQHGSESSAHVEKEKRALKQWVSRKDQELFLRANNYKAQAIGIPFLYLLAQNSGQPSSRVPGSLLVMPPHSHHCHGPGDPLAEAYAAAIDSKRKHFSEVWVCLHTSDYLRDEWVEPFRKRNIPIFHGAEQGDQNTLHRLRRILSSFEFVTTNGFGSHIAYAAACGAKVSVFGPYANSPRHEMAVSTISRLNPDLTDVILDLHSERSLRTHYPFLFVEPERAVAHEQWGLNELGAEVRVGPEELVELFGLRELEMYNSSDHVAPASD